MPAASTLTQRLFLLHGLSILGIRADISGISENALNPT